MYKTDPLLIEKCRTLRKQGLTLGGIVEMTKLPKTTIYEHVRNIHLSPELKEKIKIIATRKINDYIRRERKGKCMPGREFIKPNGWSPALIFLTSHFMFDGQIKHSGCEYYNRNDYLIKKIQAVTKKLLGLCSKIYPRDFGVKQLRYYNVELGTYIKQSY